MTQLPSNLQAKIGTGFGLDPRLLAKLEATAATYGETFRTSLQSDIAALAEALDRAEENPLNGQQSINRIRRIAFDLRGSGGSFDYGLVSTVGRMMWELAERHRVLSRPLVPVLRAHVDVLRAVLKEDIQGDGGTIGRELTECLNLLTARAERQLKSDGA